MITFMNLLLKALHIVQFESFVKSMTSCLSKLKVTPSYCFPFKIPDDPTATNLYNCEIVPEHWHRLG